MSTEIYELPRLYPAEWASSQRAETLSLFAGHVYGHTPTGGAVAGVEIVAEKPDALGGLARRTESTVTVAGPGGSRQISLLVYVPAAAARPVPAFLGLNFAGNHATTNEPDIRIPSVGLGRDTARGAKARRWPYEQILGHGYAVATAHYEEIEVDAPGNATAGVRGLFAEDNADPEAWGAIGAWAWGLSRLREALGVFSDISAVFAVGHSRLGKTALWAAAQDQRFAGVISNDSGCGGASLFRHKGVEDITVITSAQPHWFAPRFADYREAEEALPVDQHQLLALQAPRPAHVASATLDAGADPYGEYLATLHAGPIFEQYGLTGPLPAGTTAPGADLEPARALALPRPKPGRRLGAHLSYHIRDGGHDVLAEDWAHFLDFADQNSAR